MHTRNPNDHKVHDIVNDAHTYGRYIMGQKKEKWKQNTFNTSDNQGINMIADALHAHVLKALTQSMHQREKFRFFSYAE